MSIRKVGFAGLGIMGSRMARNLVKKGFEVSVWNRTAAKAQALANEGVKVARSPAELAEGMDAFCTCVADPAALEDVALGARGLFESARSGALFVDFSTVSVELTRKLASRFASKQVDFVEAPITGSKSGAERGTLLVMAGASPKAFERARPLFDAVGEKAILCGPVGAGTQVKLAGNVLIALMLEGLSEGMLLARKAGVDPRKVLEVVQASGFRSPYFDFKGRCLLERDFSTHFSIDLMLKDLSLFVESAAQHRVPAPAAAAIRAVYERAHASGAGEQDIAAAITPIERDAGVEIAAPL